MEGEGEGAYTGGRLNRRSATYLSTEAKMIKINQAYRGYEWGGRGRSVPSLATADTQNPSALERSAVRQACYRFPLSCNIIGPKSFWFSFRCWSCCHF